MTGAKIKLVCGLCLITRPCGKQMNGANIRIHSDLSSCSNVPPTTLDVKPSTPKTNLCRLLSLVERLFNYSTIVEANKRLLRSLKLKLQAQPNHAFKQNTKDRQSYCEQAYTFNIFLKEPIQQLSIVMSPLYNRIVVFLFSTVAHLEQIFVLHGSRKLQVFPFSHKMNPERTPLKPFVVVEDWHLDQLQNHKSC